MKKILLLVFVLTAFLGACRSTSTTEDSQPSKRLYIEDGEYDGDAAADIQRERRGAPPVVESNYIFRVLPKDTYFYNEKNMPMHGGEAATASDGGVVSAETSDYKEPYLWNKAKRYMGNEVHPANTGGSGGYEE